MNRLGTMSVVVWRMTETDWPLFYYYTRLSQLVRAALTRPRADGDLLRLNEMP
jgi:hypothetical protein